MSFPLSCSVDALNHHAGEIEPGVSLSTRLKRTRNRLRLYLNPPVLRAGRTLDMQLKFLYPRRTRFAPFNEVFMRILSQCDVNINPIEKFSTGNQIYCNYKHLMRDSQS